MTKEQFMDLAVISMTGNSNELLSNLGYEQMWLHAENIWNARPKKEKVVATPKKNFVKPSHEEVSAYIREKGYKSFNASSWLAHYESKGWMIGKNKMKDWKASVRTWGAKEVQEKTQQIGFV